ncbi:hypothetical protein OCU04_012306 [Sclerotinia nivalis]|uniref:Uncharacterized protein n=1 Tax=Sclerotinia nivalis TaxID=352851 RepID=A0A9X0ABG0_9HELO|nr:hypothetical protein OCU04_012306 [Sclerotinia nivalis]
MAVARIPGGVELYYGVSDQEHFKEVHPPPQRDLIESSNLIMTVLLVTFGFCTRVCCIEDVKMNDLSHLQVSMRLWRLVEELNLDVGGWSKRQNLLDGFMP